MALRFIEDHGAGVEGVSTSDKTDLDCPIFNYPGTTTPVEDTGFAEMLPERSAVMIHEMWHHWQDSKRLRLDSHQRARGQLHRVRRGLRLLLSPRAGFCPSGRHLFGPTRQLNKTNVINNVGLYFHSPYQVMVEFEADVSNQGTAFTPYNLRREARSVAIVHITSNFVNAPAYLIGVPAPVPALYP